MVIRINESLKVQTTAAAAELTQYFYSQRGDWWYIWVILDCNNMQAAMSSPSGWLISPVSTDSSSQHAQKRPILRSSHDSTQIYHFCCGITLGPLAHVGLLYCVWTSAIYFHDTSLHFLCCLSSAVLLDPDLLRSAAGFLPRQLVNCS